MIKQLTFYIWIFTFLIILHGCQKDEVPKPQPEQGYPKIYKPLSSSEWEARNNQFQKINIHEGLSLNEFGFVEGEIQLNSNDSVTADFVIENIENLIERYGVFMGIENEVNVNTDVGTEDADRISHQWSNINNYFILIDQYSKIGYGFNKHKIERPQSHNLRLKQYKIGGSYFEGPTQHFVFDEINRTIRLFGNWLPKASLPPTQIYSIEEATTIVYRHLLNESGYDSWETKHTFSRSKVIIYLEKESIIEIHECWKIRVPVNKEYFSHIFYIDTQTGEILKGTKERHNI